MKRFISLPNFFSSLLFLLISISASSRILYLSPSGNDNNSGTVGSPFFTLNKAWTVVAAGDTVYLRGGTYNWSIQQYLLGKNGTATNKINVWNYPGESPVLTQSGSYPTDGQDLIYFQGNYVHWKGLEIANCTRDVNYSAFRTEAASNCIWERIYYHHNKLGFALRGQVGTTTNNLILNCDFAFNEDPALDNADGINITFIANTSSVNTVRGCRAWNNSDDGFDNWENQGTVIYENCWAWRNGYKENGTDAGDGGGFKFGQTGQSTSVRRVVKNCVAANNRKWGFVENSSRFNMQFYNNTAVENGTLNWWFGDWGTSPKTFTNNITIGGGSLFGSDGYRLGTDAIETTNSWNGIVTANSSDFQSYTYSQLGNARQSDGSLPEITYLHITTGSDLIDAGTNVGLSYNGAAPDLGAFESGGTSNNPPTANAGTDQTITLPTNSVTLTGSGTDTDGTIASYLWTKISGPVTFTIVSPSAAQTVINNLVQGTYVFRLTVTDNSGATGYDDIQVTVDAAPSSPPSGSVFLLKGKKYIFKN